MAQHICHTELGKAQDCQGCDAQTDAFLAAHPNGGVMGADEMGKPAVRRDMLDARTVRSPFDVSDLDSLGFLRPITEFDPQRKYDTDPNPQRAALRAVLADHDDARAVSNRQAARTVLRMAEDTSRVDRGRADFRAASRAVLAAHDVREWVTVSTLPTGIIGPEHKCSVTVAGTLRDSSDALRPDFKANGTTLPRWAEDRRTLGGPVVTTGADGTPLRVTVDRIRVTGDVERVTVRWTDVLAVRPSARTVQRVLSITGVRTDGTRWRADRTTADGDRFVAALESSGPVLKPSTRKRKRDGGVGGPVIPARF